MGILIENISKSFKGNLVLNYVNLEIKTGSLVALVGPSGSGKSTLLRTIAGFENPEEGRIWLFGKESTQIPIQNREVGFVFQNYALFDHLNVFDNIAFGLSLRDIDPINIKKRVFELIELVQLNGFQERYPKQLSGGQRQRVALARALAIEPKVLLLDEPFGALDEKVKKELGYWLKNLHNQVPVTTIFVTHDQQEALDIATDIVIFRNGKVEQMGSPQEVYDYPVNNFILEFMGNTNKLILPNLKSAPIQLRPHEFKIFADFKPGTILCKITHIIFGEPLIKIIGEVNHQPLELLIGRKSFFTFSHLKVNSLIYIKPFST
jgi:sulfate transport system ATP-binding protein